MEAANHSLQKGDFMLNGTDPLANFSEPLLQEPVVTTANVPDVPDLAAPLDMKELTRDDSVPTQDRTATVHHPSIFTNGHASFTPLLNDLDAILEVNSILLSCSTLIQLLDKYYCFRFYGLV